MDKILEIIEDNKDAMQDGAYLNIMNGLQKVHNETKGNLTTDYRQMYLDLKQQTELFEKATATGIVKIYRHGDDPHWETYERGFGGWVLHEQNWERCRLLHRDGDLPAVIGYWNGKKSREEWYKEGKRHREGDQPAYILYYYPDGGKSGEAWFQDGKSHREGDLPTHIRYWMNGNKMDEEWHNKGRLHRVGKPAKVVYNKEDGSIEREEYWTDGQQTGVATEHLRLRFLT